MKIIIAAIAFLVTIGGLFLFDGQKPVAKTDYAQIIKNITAESSSVTSADLKISKHSLPSSPDASTIGSAAITQVPTPAPTFSSVPTPSKTPSATFLSTSTPAPSQTPAPTPAATFLPTLTPSQTPTPVSSFTPTPTPTPVVSTHTYYTSNQPASSATAKYIYCDTSNGLKNPLTFATLEDALADFPNRSLYKPCK